MDCFEDPELARKVFLVSLPLVNLSVMLDEALKTHHSVALLELIQKHLYARDVIYKLKRWIEQDRLHFKVSLHADDKILVGCRLFRRGE